MSTPPFDRCGYPGPCGVADCPTCHAEDVYNHGTVRRLGPLDVWWGDRRHWWLRLFGLGLAARTRDEWRVLSCRERRGWCRYHIEVGSLVVCPLRPMRFGRRR